MTKKFSLKVTTPEGEILSKEVEFLFARSDEGDLGILANHAPLIASLVIGVISYKENDKEHKIAISGGFMEVSNNIVTILANTAEIAENIDLDRAKAAKDRAEKRLKEHKPDTDLIRAETALKRALARIKATEKI